MSTTHAVLRWLCALAAAGTVQAAGYDTVRIAAPADETTVHDNLGNVSVLVQIEPALRAAAGERIELLLDDKVVASGPHGRIELASVERGTHALQARVVAADGKVLHTSAAVRFHLWRASRLFPGREK